MCQTHVMLYNLRTKFIRIYYEFFMYVHKSVKRSNYKMLQIPSNWWHFFNIHTKHANVPNIFHNKHTTDTRLYRCSELINIRQKRLLPNLHLYDSKRKFQPSKWPWIEREREIRTNTYAILNEKFVVMPQQLHAQHPPEAIKTAKRYTYTQTKQEIFSDTGNSFLISFFRLAYVIIRSRG